jgi:DNA-binding protein Fis
MARGRTLHAEHLPAVPASPPPETLTSTLTPEQKLTQALACWVRSQLETSPDLLPENLYATAHQQLDAALLPAVLGLTRQNRTAAARILGLDRATLRSRLRAINAGETSDDE